MATATALKTDDYISLTDAGELAKCSRQWIAYLIDHDRLPALTIAGQRFVRREDVRSLYVKRAAND